MGLGPTLMPGDSGFKKVGVVIRLEEWFLLESIIAFLVPINIFARFFTVSSQL